MGKFSAERLKEALNNANMTGYALAKKCDFSTSCMSGYMRGNNIPTQDRIKVIADALGVPVEFLIEQDGEESTPLCLYNDGVRCAPGDRICEACGWNPDVARSRLEQYCIDNNIPLPTEGNEDNQD